GSFSYTPSANFNGADTFSYHANDGLADSNTTTVAITVNPVNDAPVAGEDCCRDNEDTRLNFTAWDVLSTDSDVENDPLSAILVTRPTHPTRRSSDLGSFSYTPSANFNGADTFTYHANDGLADSNTATVTITVNPVNDAPVNSVPGS